MKYIVYLMDGKEHAIVFPKHLVHKNIARCLIPQDPFLKCIPVGAGFFEDGVVHGYSEGMNLNSRPKDLEVIRECYQAS